jgi:hypothetical protein
MANITKVDLKATPPVTPSEIGFYLGFTGDGAKEIANEPERVEQVYAEIQARLKAEAEEERKRQEQVDGLADSTPEDLADYLQREV